jgi:hypothetical protein
MYGDGKRMNLINKPIISATIIFWTIQGLIIANGIDNLIIVSLVDFNIIVHILLWFVVADFKYKSKEYTKDLVTPLYFLAVLLLISLVTGYIIKGIIWTYSLFLSGIIPLLVSDIYILYVIYRDKKFNEYFFKKRKEKYHKIVSYSKTISSIIILLVLLSPTIIVFADTISTDNEAEMKQIVRDLTKDCVNDTQKTLALLSWFNRGVGVKENFANIYYRERQEDNEILLGIGDYYIFSKPPHFCVRGDSFDWIASSRCGRCKEVSILFNHMCYFEGLEVRQAVCIGEDHQWNEVKIDGQWIVVDATEVKLPKKTGFNLSKDFMEEKVRGEYEKSKRPAEGNVSYVYAQYLDGREDEDITHRYTNTMNITIRTVNNKNQSIPNVSISIYSLNSATTSNHERVIIKKKTNETGYYTFSLGDGNYIFTAEKGDLKVSKTFEFNKSNLNYNRTIVLK